MKQVGFDMEALSVLRKKGFTINDYTLLVGLCTLMPKEDTSNFKGHKVIHLEYGDILKHIAVPFGSSTFFECMKRLQGRGLVYRHHSSSPTLRRGYIINSGCWEQIHKDYILEEKILKFWKTQIQEMLKLKTIR